MMAALDRLAHEAAVRVSVQATQGSVPRGPGTHMLVFAHGEAGTIGGGHLEFQALAHARRLLAGELVPTHLRQVLGPSLGQCCGGVVELTMERVDEGDVARLRTLLMPPRTPLALFGGGHVGRAIVNTLAPLPFVGLIGSATKWATFRHRLEDRGFTAEEIARITCPIGVPGITGKEPEVIAVAVAAQLLQTL